MYHMMPLLHVKVDHVVDQVHCPHWVIIGRNTLFGSMAAFGS